MHRFDAARCLAEADRSVELAKQRAGLDPVLLAYDANAIQNFLGASDRLHAMRGASRVVSEFDAGVLRDHEGACLFAGGGRGLLLVASDAASSVAQRLVRHYEESTRGERLAVATAPLGADEAASLRLLRQRMAIAKDEAPAPVSPLFTDADNAAMCADCHRRPVAQRVLRHGGEAVEVCVRCDALYEKGAQAAREKDERGLKLDDLSKSNRVAVVSADGNEMGRLFSSLKTVREQAVVSRAVSAIFANALDAARQAAAAAFDEAGATQLGQVTPVAGGDDVRAFIGPEVVVPFIDALVRAIEAEADRSAGALELNPEAESAFRHIGLGAGIVVAPFALPAPRLMDLAQSLEAEAKRVCGEGGARSAVRVALLRSGDELSESGGSKTSGDGAIRGEALVFSGTTAKGGRRWGEELERARALAKVGKSQRSQLREANGLSAEERLNLFRYQVARNKDWQRYFATIRLDWTRPDQLTAAAIPSWTTQELARLVQFVPGGRTQGRTER